MDHLRLGSQQHIGEQAHELRVLRDGANGRYAGRQGERCVAQEQCKPLKQAVVDDGAEPLAAGVAPQSFGT